METLFITHPVCHEHEMGSWHPESPLRLDAISDQLVASGLMDFLTHAKPIAAEESDILRVHQAQYLEYLRNNVPEQGYFNIDPDTCMNPRTLDAAWLAAGAGITAVDKIIAGDARTAFCAVRPPGHHARPHQAMGFCFFNNIAITALYAIEKYGIKKIAIIDFDVHHGNGTEETFAHDDRIMMCSFYQYPLFPENHVADPGPNMINVPVEAYSGGDVIRDLAERFWFPALDEFQPELILISAGFDAHREDDMASLKLVESDYAWITSKLVNIADKYCGGRIISMLEGGYDLSALGRSVVAHVRSLGRY